MKNIFKKRWFRIFIGVVFFLFFAFVTFLVTKKSSPVQEVNEIPPVLIEKPFYGNLSQSITLNAYVEAKVMIPVVPFVQGTIIKYDVKPGLFVEKNQLLAKIDDAPFRQTMLQAQAAYFAAKSTFDRVESLYKNGATTRQNYDSVRAQHDAAKAQYDLAKLQMDYTDVKSPVAGTVLIADQAEGSIASQTQPVAVIADLTNLVVRLKVPEKYYDLFLIEKENIKIEIIRPAEKEMYEDAVSESKIENIAPYISPSSKNFIVECSLVKPDERFKPGMFVKVKVSYKNFQNVPLLPVTTRKLDGSVYIYSEEDKKVHFIQMGEAVCDDSNFVVPEEYSSCWFVVDGQNSVFDGQEVKVLNEVE